MCTPTLKSVTDVPDAKDLGEEGLCSPEHHQQPKSSCPHTWAPFLLSASLLHTLRDYTVIFSISLSIDFFFCQPIFSSSSSFTSLMRPEGKSSCLHCLSMKISCAAGFVKQLIKDNAINYSLMK